MPFAPHTIPAVLVAPLAPADGDGPTAPPRKPVARATTSRTTTPVAATAPPANPRLPSRPRRIHGRGAAQPSLDVLLGRAHLGREPALEAVGSGSGASGATGAPGCLGSLIAERRAQPCEPRLELRLDGVLADAEGRGRLGDRKAGHVVSTTAARTRRGRAPRARRTATASVASGVATATSTTPLPTGTNRRSRRTSRKASRAWMRRSHARRAPGSRSSSACRRAISKVVCTRSCASASFSVMARAAARSSGPCAWSAAPRSGRSASTAPPHPGGCVSPIKRPGPVETGECRAGSFDRGPVSRQARGPAAPAQGGTST